MAKTHLGVWNFNMALQLFSFQAPVCTCSVGFFKLEGMQGQLILSQFGGALSLWSILFGERGLHLNLCVTKMKSRIGFIFLLTHFGAV